MKRLPSIITMLLLLQFCQTKHEQADSPKSLIGKCDELDIVYYTKDSFAYKTIDTVSVNFFKELITLDNETLTDTCEPTGQIIYRNKGQIVFVADVATKNIKDSISCEYVTYHIDNKMYRHRLTYRHGMSIDEIYWHKVDPKGNPWGGVDSAKFHYEEIKSNR